MGKGIIVCGLNGSGKSTLARALAEAFGCQYIDIEQCYFPQGEDGYVYDRPCTRAQAEARLLQRLSTCDRFVLAAIKGDYGPAIESAYQAAVYLRVPRETRIQRVWNRSHDKFGSRMLPGGDLHEQETRFFDTVAAREDSMVEDWLKTLSCPVITLDGTLPIAQNVSRLAALSVRARLMALSEPAFQQFQRRLVPTVPPETILGVRTPVLRSLAREMRKTGQAAAYLEALPHDFLEEYVLHGCIISLEKDYDTALAQTQRYLPYIDNWITCDLLSPKVFSHHREALYPHIVSWINASAEYTIRFGVEMLMTFYLDDGFDPAYLALPAAVSSDAYYVRMMVAWFFATALAKQYDAALPYLEQHRLPLWTHNKTIQKALESYRIAPEQKEYLKTLRRKADARKNANA